MSRYTRGSQRTQESPLSPSATWALGMKDRSSGLGLHLEEVPSLRSSGVGEDSAAGVGEEVPSNANTLHRDGEPGAEGQE